MTLKTCPMSFLVARSATPKTYKGMQRGSCWYDRDESERTRCRQAFVGTVPYRADDAEHRAFEWSAGAKHALGTKGGSQIE